MKRKPELLCIPKEQKPASYSLTNNGVFTEGDICISREGCIIGNESPASTRPSSRASNSSLDHGRGSDRFVAEDLSLQGDQPRIHLADLEDVRVVGNGSSGIVYRVRMKSTNQILAKKVIQLDLSCDEARKRVLMELTALSGSGSPYIVKYYQAFFENGAITIVMEYLDGGSLCDVLKRLKRGIPEEYLAEVARQVLAGLHYLHSERHVIHRDIKPSNILVSSSGDLKISDFGVSGQLTSSISECKSWVGTVTYFSPERIKGDSYSFDSDIWSLGLSLVECALGRFPYPPPGDAALPPGAQMCFFDLLEYIVNEPAPQLPYDKFSSEFLDFVDRCLRKNPSERATAEELLNHPWLAKHPKVSLSNLVSGQVPHR